MIWAIVSSQSYFIWLYRASPSLAAKHIIKLILVLTIFSGSNLFVIPGRGREYQERRKNQHKTHASYEIQQIKKQAVQLSLNFKWTTDTPLSISISHAIFRIYLRSFWVFLTEIQIYPSMLYFIWQPQQIGSSKNRQSMRWLYGITDSTDNGLSRPQELVMNREACCAAVHGVSKSWTGLSDWAELMSWVLEPPSQGLREGDLSSSDKGSIWLDISSTLLIVDMRELIRFTHGSHTH